MNPFIHAVFAGDYREGPLTLVDVGAKGGLRKSWRPLQDHLRVIGFELDDRSRGGLPATVNRLDLPTALSNEPARVPFYQMRNSSVSSLLKPDPAALARFGLQDDFEIVSSRTIETDTLDRQLARNGLPEPDILKVDTQGSELMILQGAREALGRSVFAVEVEVETLPIYHQQPLFADVDQFMRGMDFELFDFRPVYFKRRGQEDYGFPKGQLVYGDALYLKSLARYSSESRGFSGPPLRRRILRAVSICIFFGYLDLADEIFRLEPDLFSESEREIFARFLRHSLPWQRRLPDFPGRRTLATLGLRVWDALRPGFFHKRVVGGRRVGNARLDNNILY